MNKLLGVEIASLNWRIVIPFVIAVGCCVAMRIMLFIEGMPILDFLLLDAWVLMLPIVFKYGRKRNNELE